jgi:2-methylcitrate dehydratase PrpD
MDAAYAFARNLATTTYKDIPADVVEITKRQIMDLLGVMLGGSSKPGAKELAELIVEWGGKEESSVLLHGCKVPAPNAAQANATMGHALDFDDVGPGPTHPSVTVIPTCLAVGEYVGGVSGQEFITAAALGIDMMCRLGKAFSFGSKTKTGGLHPGAGWHLTTLYGYIASAGVAGRILGLDEKKLVNAMGIAYHQCSGNGQCVNEGALTKRMGPGFSARGGVSAAFMARKGITGAESCLEGQLGLYNLYHHGEYDPQSLTADLGKVFAGTAGDMKLYPCCKGTHSHADTALSLLNTNSFAPADIEEITLFTEDEKHFLISPFEKRSRPQNPVDAQFSIPWVVAVIFARGWASIGDFTEEAIRSADILDVSGKMKIAKDASLTRSPGRDPAKIAVKMKSGVEFVGQSEGLLNESKGPLPWAGYERKFKDCAAYSVKPLSDGQIEELISRVKQLEHVDDIKEIVEFVR